MPAVQGHLTRWCEPRASCWLRQAQVAATGPAIAEAAEWLSSVLREGPQPAVDLEQRAKIDGIHERTLLRAKQRLGIVARREGFGTAGQWVWQLPKA